MLVKMVCTAKISIADIVLCWYYYCLSFLILSEVWQQKKNLAVKNVVYLSFWANLDLPTKLYIFGVWLDWDVGKIKIIEKPEHPFSIVKGLPRFLFRPFLDWDVGKKIKIIVKPEHPCSIVKGLPGFLFRPFLLAMLHVYIPNTKDWILKFKHLKLAPVLELKAIFFSGIIMFYFLGQVVMFFIILFDNYIESADC